MNPSNKITIAELQYENRICPMVLVGRTTDDFKIYIRYRWGRLSIRIDSRADSPSDGVDGVRIFDAQIGDNPHAAWIEYDELRAVTADLIVWPDTEPD